MLRVSVATPCLNAQPYLGDAIASVLGQTGIELEYMVMDGGSTDGSRELIEAHAPRLAYWCSRPDGGQAAALNEAFARSTGDIMCWLNADDFFLPQALVSAAAQIASGAADLVSGSCLLFAADGGWAGIKKPPATLMPSSIAVIDPLDQPSTFWSRRLWEATGPLDESLHFTMDWDWFNRAVGAGARYEPLDRLLSAYRFHAGHKTGTGGAKRRDEIRTVVSRYAMPPWPDVFNSVDEHLLRGLAHIERALGRRALWRLRPLARETFLTLMRPALARSHGVAGLLHAARVLQ
jgi:glycosyltransferase involved in cell wall biosynthesis